MFCDDCGKNMATIFITQIENNKVVRKKLCEECARQSLMPQNALEFLALVPQMLSQAYETGWELQVSEDLKEEVLICEECATTITDVKETGKMGCPECYGAFAGPLMSLIRDIQVSDQHMGKIPLRSSELVQLKRKLVDLMNKLKVLVESEDFEVAAEVRDEIKTVEAQLLLSENGDSRG